MLKDRTFASLSEETSPVANERRAGISNDASVREADAAANANAKEFDERDAYEGTIERLDAKPIACERVRVRAPVSVTPAALERGLRERVVRVGAFVQCHPGYGDQPKVANGASELLAEIFGEAGRHARAAVGSVALPLGATVEVELVAEVE